MSAGWRCRTGRFPLFGGIGFADEVTACIVAAAFDRIAILVPDADQTSGLVVDAFDLAAQGVGFDSGLAFAIVGLQPVVAFGGGGLCGATGAVGLHPGGVTEGVLGFGEVACGVVAEQGLLAKRVWGTHVRGVEISWSFFIVRLAP